MTLTTCLVYAQNITEDYTLNIKNDSTTIFTINENIMINFTIKELTKSATANRLKIDNTPTDSVIKNLNDLVDNVLDPLRKAYGKPIVVTSGYRSLKLNKAVGGVPNSQHTLGQAADIRSVSDSPAENKRIYDLIRELNLPVDQCINEYGYDWIHVSYSPRHRRQYFKIG